MTLKISYKKSHADLLGHSPLELLAGISKTDGGDAPALLRAIRVTS